MCFYLRQKGKTVNKVFSQTVLKDCTDHLRRHQMLILLSSTLQRAIIIIRPDCGFPKKVKLTFKSLNNAII